MMLELFTEKSIKTVMLAQEEARRMKHNYVDTEQLLLGLIGEGTGIASKALKASGVKLKDARIVVEEMIGTGDLVQGPWWSMRTPPTMPFTAKAKMILELAHDESVSLGHKSVSTEHLLLGLIGEAKICVDTEEPQGVAFRTLQKLGVDLDALHQSVMQLVVPKK